MQFVSTFTLFLCVWTLVQADLESSETTNEGLLEYMKEEFSHLEKTLETIERSNNKLVKEVHTVLTKRDGAGTSNKDIPCEDRSRHCKQYVEKNYCAKAPSKMARKCSKSCNLCHQSTSSSKNQTDTEQNKISEDSECKDRKRSCPKYVRKNYCTRSPSKMRKLCPKSCKLCPEKKVVDKKEETEQQTQSDVTTQPTSEASSDKFGDYEEDTASEKEGEKTSGDKDKNMPDGKDGGTKSKSDDKDDKREDGIFDDKYDREEGISTIDKNQVDSDDGIDGVDDDDDVKEKTQEVTKCKDKSSNCERYLKKGYCENHKEKMRKKCQRSCDMCQKAQEEERKEDIDAPKHSFKQEVRDCKDKKSKCSHYAKKGYCEKKSEKMKKLCRKSCKFCDTGLGKPKEESTIETDAEEGMKIGQPLISEPHRVSLKKKHSKEIRFSKGMKLVISSTKKMFSFDFQKKTWTEETTSPHPRAMLFHKNQIYWATTKEVGMFAENGFESRSIFKWKGPVDDVFVDSKNNLFYAMKQGKGEVYQLDIAKRSLLQIQPVSGDITVTDVASINGSVHIIGHIANQTVVEEIIELVGESPKVMKHFYVAPDLGNATVDNYRNGYLYIRDLTLYSESMSNRGYEKKLATMPGPVYSIHPTADYVLLFGRKKVHVFDRESAEVNTLPKIDLDRETLSACVLYKPEKKPEKLVAFDIA